MATLLAIFSRRKCLARCDANCYRRKSTRNNCACGGRNRARGLPAARAATLANWWHWVEEWKAEHPRVEVTKVIRPITIIILKPLTKAL